ncbi:MAG: type II toxin-antitoxin system RelE/ParE family toxin [Clostridiales bacterium]|nr:type II toxin-antitoxin system RelE/ParE family toxin [Clostridiales bacterium]
MGFKYDYQLSQKAEADLDEIVSYISIELSNPQAATAFVGKLQKAIDEVRSVPEGGSLVVNEYLSMGNIRKKNIGNYIMYYQPDHDAGMIYVPRILYVRRNLDEILREMDI